MRLLVLLVLLASPHASAAAERGWIGVVYNAQPDGARVKLVLAGTPADEAELRIGDVLLTVDGEPLAGLTVNGMSLVLTGDVGTTAELRLRRGAAEHVVSLVRIARPDDERVTQLRAEAELAAAPPDRRAVFRLQGLPPEATQDDVLQVWRDYLAERGERKVGEPVVVFVLQRLADGGPGEPWRDALRAVVHESDEHLGTQPRYQRRIASMFAGLEPPDHEGAVARAERGLELAGVGHREHPQLQKVLATSLLALGDVDGALQASAAALETWTPPTLIWLDLDGAEQHRLVVDGSSSLARLRAEALTASGDEDGARAVLQQRLALRYDEETAADLTALGGAAPPLPRSLGALDAEGFPPFDLPELGGDGRVRLADLAGEPTLVVLWASWCHPCRAELTHLAAVYDALVADGVQVLAVNVMDELPAARGALETEGWPFPVVVDDQRELTAALSAGSVPRAYVLDGQGRVVASYQGYSETSAREQEALLRSLAGGAERTPHLLEVELGDDRLELRAFHALAGAEHLARTPSGEVLVGTGNGRMLLAGASGLHRERDAGTGLRDLHALPGGTWVGVGKKRVTLVPAEGELQRVGDGSAVMATAVVAGQLVVAPGGRKALTAYDGASTLLWSGGEEAVTWALVTLRGAGGEEVGRLSPGKVERVGRDGTARGTFELPVRATGMAAVDSGVIVSSSLAAVSQGDLDGDGAVETVVLLGTRQVIGLSAQREVLFRFALPVDGDVLCADTDGDGRDEVWIASAAAGVGCLTFSP